VLAVTGRPCDTSTGKQLVQAAELELLEGAELDGAALEGAALEGAALEGATLDGAELDGADELGVLLAILDGALLVGVAELLEAELPDGAGASLLYSITRKLSK
jgi:uncharacterized protein YjbI with pentapeptide repeats